MGGGGGGVGVGGERIQPSRLHYCHMKNLDKAKTLVLILLCSIDSRYLDYE